MLSIRRDLIALACGFLAVTSTPSPAAAATQDYRFELIGKPQVARGGKNIVSVRLVHVPDNKPVAGAVVFETKADMGPAGMAAMTVPVKAMPAQGEAYRFEIEPSMAGPWALSLAAKVQGEAETVRGSITVDLAK